MIPKIKTEFPLSRLHLLIISSGIFLGAGIIFFLPFYLDWITELGHRIYGYSPKWDYTVANDYLTALVFAMFLGVSIIFWPVKHEDKYHLFWAWIFKSLTTLIIILFLEEKYQSDSFGYWSGPLSYEFSDLVVYQGLIFGIDHMKRGTSNVMLLIFHYNKFMPEFLTLSFHCAKLLFSMIGFIGIYIFYRASVIFTQRENISFFWFLALFPSLIIWTSRIGKEPMVLFTISLYILGIVSWHFKKQARYLILIFIGFIFTMHLRLWMGMILMIPLILYFFFSQKGVQKLFILLLSVSLGVATLNKTMSGMQLYSPNHVVQQFDKNLTTKSKGGSKLKVKNTIQLENWKDVIVKAPGGMFTAIFRPLPGDMLSPIGLLASFECLLLLFLFIRAFVRTKMVELKNPLMITASSFILLWAFFYGFAGYNFGTIVRWKTQILPLFLGLTLYLGRSRPAPSLGTPSSNSATFGN